MGWTKINKRNLRVAIYSCDHTNFAILEKFVQDNDLKFFRDDIGFGTTIQRFFENGGKSCGKTFLDLRAFFGRDLIDHCTLFKNGKGEVVLTTQPFIDSKTILEEFNCRFSNDFSIEIYDTNKSWYYPGQSVLAVIRLKKDYGNQH